MSEKNAMGVRVLDEVWHDNNEENLRKNILKIVRNKKTIKEEVYDNAGNIVEQPEVITLDIGSTYDKETNSFDYHGYYINLSGKQDYTMGKLYITKYDSLIIMPYQRKVQYNPIVRNNITDSIGAELENDETYFNDNIEIYFILGKLCEQYFTSEKIIDIHNYELEDNLYIALRNIINIYNKSLALHKSNNSTYSADRFEICFDENTKNNIINELNTLDLQIATKILDYRNVIKDKNMSKFNLLDDINRDLKVLENDVIYRHENYGDIKLKKDIPYLKSRFNRLLISKEDRDRLNELNYKKIVNIPFSENEHTQYNNIIKNIEDKVNEKIRNLKRINKDDISAGISSPHIELKIVTTKQQDAYRTLGKSNDYYNRLSASGKYYKVIIFNDEINKIESSLKKLTRRESNQLIASLEVEYDSRLDSVIEKQSKNKYIFLQCVINNLQNKRKDLELYTRKNSDIKEILFILEHILNINENYNKFILAINLQSGRLLIFDDIDYATQQVVTDILGDGYQYLTKNQLYNRLADSDTGYISKYNKTLKALERYSKDIKNNDLDINAAIVFENIDRMRKFENLNELFSNSIKLSDEVKAKFYRRFNDEVIGQINEILNHNIELNNLIDVLTFRKYLQNELNLVSKKIDGINTDDSLYFERKEKLSSDIKFLEDEILEGALYHKENSDLIFNANPEDSFSFKSILDTNNVIDKFINMINEKTNNINNKYDKDTSIIKNKKIVFNREKKLIQLKQGKEEELKNLLKDNQMEINKIISELSNLVNNLNKTNAKAIDYSYYLEDLTKKDGTLYNRFLKMGNKVNDFPSNNEENYNKERKIASLIAGIITLNGINDINKAFDYLINNANETSNYEHYERYKNSYIYRLIIDEFKGNDSYKVKELKAAYNELMYLKQEENIDFTTFKDSILLIAENNYKDFCFVVADSERDKYIFKKLLSGDLVEEIRYNDKIITDIKTENDLYLFSVFLKEFKESNEADKDSILYAKLFYLMEENYPDVGKNELHKKLKSVIEHITAEGLVKASKFSLKINTEHLSVILEQIVSQYKGTDDVLICFELYDENILLNCEHIEFNEEIFTNIMSRKSIIDFGEVNLDEFKDFINCISL